MLRKIDQKLLLFVILFSLIWFSFLSYPKLLDLNLSADAKLAIRWNPTLYALGFCLGITAYRLRESDIVYKKFGGLVLATAIISFGILVLSPVSKNYAISYIFFSVLTFFLILTGSNTNKMFRLLFQNRVVLFIGTISFGIYLCHLPLLAILARLDLVAHSWLSLIILSSISILISTLTFKVS